MKFFSTAPAAIAAALVTAATASAQLAPLTSFGGGDGWFAPGEGGYTFLTTGNTERGLAYNSATNNLILVSRAGGNNIRVLDATTGTDLRGLDVTGIAGGTFAVNMTGVGGDGAVYVGNLTTAVATSPYKIYRWASDAGGSPPTTFFDSSVTSITAPPARLGDTFDVTGSGAGTTFVAGAGSPDTGYVILASGTPTYVSSFTPPVGGGDFRLGLTFADSPTAVWGKQTGNTFRQTTYSGSTGTLVNSPALTTAGETAMDFTTIGGVPFLATVDINSSIVRVYNMADPANPFLESSLTTTTSFTANGNGTGSVAWGPVIGSTATLYAMNTNNGIQAFSFVPIPEPATPLALAGGAGLGFWVRRRRLKA
jgi:hypothetical protein